jgi:hypothetical protein
MEKAGEALSRAMVPAIVLQIPLDLKVRKPESTFFRIMVLTKVENAVEVEPVGEFELKGIRRPLAAYNVLGAVSQ